MIGKSRRNDLPGEEGIIAIEDLEEESGNVGDGEAILIDQKVSKSGLLSECSK